MITGSHSDAMRLLVLRLLVLATAVGAVFLLLASAGAADEPPGPTTTYVVESGDTLWAIAASVAPEGSDLRVTVDAIADLNDLAEGVIFPGQALQLPSQ